MCVCGVKGKKKRVVVCVAGGMKFNVRVEMRGFINSTSKWRLLESCPSPAEFQYVVKKKKKRNERLGRLWSHVNCVFGLPRRSRTCTRDQQQTASLFRSVCVHRFVNNNRMKKEMR